MNDKNRMTVSWFSAGVSSAVATWLMRDKIDRIIYTHIEDQHSDTLRFVLDCQKWFGKKIEILYPSYKSVNNAILASAGKTIGYINGPNGAVCTKLLKIRTRKDWECDNQWFTLLRYVWGMDCNEGSRLNDLRDGMPNQEHSCPLIDNGITKEEAHAILKKAGIRRPEMYELGYCNNNCVGCVKGGMGYWNKIRVDFPDVFESRAKIERTVNASCLKKKRPDMTKPASAENNARLFLDELDSDAGRDEKPITEECGVMCGILFGKETI